MELEEKVYYNDTTLKLKITDVAIYGKKALIPIDALSIYQHKRNYPKMKDIFIFVLTIVAGIFFKEYGVLGLREEWGFVSLPFCFIYFLKILASFTSDLRIYSNSGEYISINGNHKDYNEISAAIEQMCKDKKATKHEKKHEKADNIEREKNVVEDSK